MDMLDAVYWKNRAEKLEKEVESLELVVVCATDIVNAWPTLTMRLLGAMTNRVDTLKQALDAFRQTR
jgi:hypothetical protein